MLLNQTSGHQDYLLFFCRPLLLRCLTSSHLASLQQRHNSTQWRRASVAAALKIHWQRGFRDGTVCPLESKVWKWATRLFFSLTHFLCTCLPHCFIFSLWILSGQQNSAWNVVLAESDGHSQIVRCLSLSCYHSCHLNKVICQKRHLLPLRFDISCSLKVVSESSGDSEWAWKVNHLQPHLYYLLLCLLAELKVRAFGICTGQQTIWLRKVLKEITSDWIKHI